LQANQLENIFSRGNEYYAKKEYPNAILCYEALVKAGKESPELYFNLANAYFKTNENTKAILFYEKSLRLKPGFQDALYNLSIANSRITDKIESLPELFFITWFKNVRNIFSADTWAIISLALFISLLASVLLFLLTPLVILRKIALSLTFTSVFLFAAGLIFAISSNAALNNKSDAIITVPSVIVKSSPDQTATDLFVIHEGTRINVRETFDDWCEIQISDGNRGWLMSDSFEVI
jgi:tetratricopeptide (TPR) repeat protein